MSSLWTPGGERPVPPPNGDSQRSGSTSHGPSPQGTPSRTSSQGAASQGAAQAGTGGAASPGDEAERVAELQRQLAATPAEAVVANHCYGLFELAALHLSAKPPRIEQARTAIDALGCLVDGMEGRLGADERTLKDGLAQIRLAFVQIEASAASADGKS